MRKTVVMVTWQVVLQIWTKPGRKGALVSSRCRLNGSIAVYVENIVWG